MLLNVNPGLIIWTVITFVLLLLVLRKLAWGPLLNAVREREKRIEESLAKAEEARKEAERRLAEYEAMIQQAKLESQEIIERGRRTAESMREEILQKTREEADRMVEKARREIALERERALEEIRDTAVSLSLEMASKLIGETITPETHQKLIKEYVKEIKVNP